LHKAEVAQQAAFTETGRLSRRPLHKAGGGSAGGRCSLQKQGGSAGGRYEKRAAVTGGRYRKNALGQDAPTATAASCDGPPVTAAVGSL